MSLYVENAEVDEVMADSSGQYCNADFAAVLYEVFTRLRKDAANGQETAILGILSPITSSALAYMMKIM